MGIVSSNGVISGIEFGEVASTTRTPKFWLMRFVTGGETIYIADVGIIAIGRWK